MRQLIARTRAELAQPEPEGLPPRVGHILRLAEIIREVDGNHDKGAGALAEAILSHPGSRWCTRAELAKPEPEGGGSIHGLEGEIVATIRAYASVEPQVGASRILHESGFGVVARAILARFGRPAIKPVPVEAWAERFEFSVFNSEYEEQAGGAAPTYAQALSEGQHYLSEYSQDGPHSLEIRCVKVLPTTPCQFPVHLPLKHHDDFTYWT
jgi:hypothetical protein